MSKRRIPGRGPNDMLSEQVGREVLFLDTLPISAGQKVTLVFEESNSKYPQGVWVGTEGALSLDQDIKRRFVLWMDGAPPAIELGVESTEGLLHFYNVWDRGRPSGAHDSLMYRSGMIVEELEDGWRRYRCNDTGPETDFRKLIFKIRVSDRATPTPMT